MSEAPSPAARDGRSREHAPASSRKPRTSPPIPSLPKARMAFLLLAGVALLAGLDASLVRLGALAPIASTSLGTVHGLLMVYGFLGTAICLERAVALQSDGRRAWAYAAPLLTGAGGISAIVISVNEGARATLTSLPIPRFLAAHLPGFAPERMMPGFLITLGMAALSAIYCYVWARRQATHAVLIQLIGALIGLGGVLLWWRGLETPRAVPWWLAFLIVTIIGERVELARLAFASGSTERRITAESAALMVGLTVALYSPTVGYPLIGLALGALMVDTAWHDVARGTVRMQGLPRLAAVCMLSGYAWALVPALMWIVAPPGLRRVRLRRRRPRDHDWFRRLHAAGPRARHHPGGRAARSPLPRRHVGPLRVPASLPPPAPSRGRARGCLPVALGRHARGRGGASLRRHDADGDDSPGAHCLA